jgi:hypothetical protein
VQRPRATDRPVRGKQRQPFDQCGGGNNPVRRIFGISCRKSQGAHAGAADGIDRYYGVGDLSDPCLAAAIEDAQRAGIAVFAIYTPGVGHYGHSYWLTYWGQIYLAKVADETGGESYYIGFNGPPVTFIPYLDDLSHRLTHQYLLTFAAKPQKKAGFQRVKLTTEVPNAELVSADRVYVPAAVP